MLHEITDSCERLFQGFGIGSNGSGHPFEKRLSSVRTRTALAIRSKKIVILRTTQAIHPRKIAIRSKGLAYPSEKIVIRRSNGSGYPLEKVVIRSDGSLLLQTTFSGAVRDEPVKTNVSFNDLRNSSKRCLPSPRPREKCLVISIRGCLALLCPSISF